MNFIFKLCLLLFLNIFNNEITNANLTHENKLISLNGNDWHFTNQNHSIHGLAKVPGNVYQDLANLNIIDQNYFLEDSDEFNTWVGQETWTYTKLFNFKSDCLGKLVLKAESLDTICNVYLNGKTIAFSNNMFAPLEIDISQSIRLGQNNLTIKFESSIKTSEELFNQTLNYYKYPVAPTSLPPKIKGLNHVNMIRKMQASFGWDWGPKFPSVGILDEIAIYCKNYFEIQSIIVDTKQVSQENSKNILNLLEWVIDVKLLIKSYKSFEKLILFKFFLNNNEMIVCNNTFNLKGSPKHNIFLDFRVKPKRTFISAWWPNNANYLVDSKNKFLKPNLYNLIVIAYEKNENQTLNIIVSQKLIKIGFREISLVQEEVNDGTSFYFKINGMPFYMRGINYVPTTLNLGNLEEEESKFRQLLKIIKKSNINMIRVWGGGYYPSEKFYDLADEYGILIWQDLMFACYLYPVDQDFLQTTKNELIYQISRLQHHPSVAIFAGNNEIESVLAYEEYEEIKKHKNDYESNYKLLFDFLVRSYVSLLAKNVPFVVSSPSNNDENMFVNPQNPKKGDIHFYDYNENCLDEKKYPNARFVSEFGFQSYPSILTLSKSLKLEHLVWPIKPELERRQHSNNMNYYLLKQIQTNLLFKGINQTGQEPLEEFIYLTQLIQALAIKLESELYISDRDPDSFTFKSDKIILKKDAKNLNMGSLIWQLNDVWPAPSWSSVDAFGNYKLLQYFIVKFYKPVIVTLTKHNSIVDQVKQDVLKVSIINDILVKADFQYIIMLYENKNGYLSLTNSTKVQTKELKPISRIEYKFVLNDFLKELGCNNPKLCFFRVRYQYRNLYKQDDNFITEDNFCFIGLPNQLALKQVNVTLISIELKYKSSQNLENVKDQDLKTFIEQTIETNHESSLEKDLVKKYIYEIVLNCKQVCLFVQLDFKLSSLISVHFSDNGFNMYNEKRKFYFIASELYETKFLENNLKIRLFN